jgi:DNA-directed RNA polymerase
METPTASIEAQIELETTQVTWGVERYMEAKAKAEKRGRDLEAGPVAKLLEDIVDAMVPAVAAYQKEVQAKVKQAVTRGVRLGGWELAFTGTTPEVLAYVTARTVLSRMSRESLTSGTTRFERHNVALAIGMTLNNQYRWDKAQREERKRVRGEDAEPKFNRLNKMRAMVKEVNPRFVRRWLRRLDDLEVEGLPRKEAMHLGFVTLDLFVGACSEYIVMERHRQVSGRQVRSFIELKYTEAVEERLKRAHVRRARALPWFMPMLCEPVDWAWSEETGGHVGGYYRTPQPLVKLTGASRHTDYGMVEDTVPQVVMDAINATQRTPWRVNQRVLAVAAQAINTGIEQLLPVALEQELPPGIAASTWARMSKEEQSAHADRRRAVHDHNNKLRAKREAMLRQIAVADNFAEQEVIYFPHNIDFRGRAYPIPQDLHPQADDLGRGVLEFAYGKPLGEGGLNWLCYHMANAYGQDKVDRPGQINWVQQHLADISAVSTDPLGDGLAFLKEADEPWQFLAACVEFTAAHAAGDPATYVSHLPIQVDGSCNGLQHLSAMGLDPVGAKAVNLTAGPRQDIYQVVADKVIWQVDNETDPTHGGKTWDNPWRGHVTRKTVKRGVMTVPYGLTSVGMKDQLISDGFCDALQGDRSENAAYLRDLMQDAISDTVVAAVKIMEWFQFNAKQLAAAGRHVSWTTPTGMMVRQEYVKPRSRRLNTVFGTASLWEVDKDATVKVNKQVTSVAPNIIHSFDAAHLFLTVNAAHEEGLSAFSLIHDSYGTHAADMDTLNRCLREQFVEIYRHDWFASIQAEFEALAGDDVELAPPPERGDFDIDEVLRSDFFFA